MLQTPLSNLQMEILELYSTNLDEDELKELKIILAKFCADKAVREADRLWDERNLSDRDMERWLNE
ncbi:hypothetical protein [Desulfonema magnum]|uniref:Uncharacterized protein n=1 Tax=Desulfonema magnum TaxID=45655 RepID=A0A975GLU7_9BACT|nr:hypothetical protein [Desulfonema magnum]QTA85965.1 Uncharacterized protein dnm_019820 [Desulfonema magnum]